MRIRYMLFLTWIRGPAEMVRGLKVYKPQRWKTATLEDEEIENGDRMNEAYTWK